MKQAFYTLLLFLLCVTLYGAAQSKGAHREQIKFTMFGKLIVVSNPDSELWSLNEISKADWPEDGPIDYIGDPVRGTVLDKTNRNYLVFNRATRKLVKPACLETTKRK